MSVSRSRSGAYLRLVGLLDVEQPADVGVAETLGQRPDVVAVAPRAVRVALAVAERVVLAVVGDPADDRSLDGQRPGNGQRDPQRALRLEGAVREVAVEADGDAEARDQVEDGREDEVGPAETPAPGDRDRDDQGHERDGDEDARGRPAPTAFFSSSPWNAWTLLRSVGERLSRSSGAGPSVRDLAGSVRVRGYATVTYGSVGSTSPARPHPHGAPESADAVPWSTRPGSFNGRTRLFGSRHRGSNPRPGARRRARLAAPIPWAPRPPPSSREQREHCSSGPGPAAVVVLAAGEGKRMRSSTPKVLHEVGRPLASSGTCSHSAAPSIPSTCSSWSGTAATRWSPT